MRKCLMIRDELISNELIVFVVNDHVRFRIDDRWVEIVVVQSNSRLFHHFFKTRSFVVVELIRKRLFFFDEILSLSSQKKDHDLLSNTRVIFQNVRIHINFHWMIFDLMNLATHDFDSYRVFDFLERSLNLRQHCLHDISYHHDQRIVVDVKIFDQFHRFIRVQILQIIESIHALQSWLHLDVFFVIFQLLMNAIVQRAICDARLLFDFDHRVHRKRREFDEISNRLQKVYSKIIVNTIVEIHLLTSRKHQSSFLILFDRVSCSNVAMLLKTMSFHVIDEQRHIIAFEIHRANELIVVNFQFRYELIQIKNEIQRRCVEKNEMSKHLIFDDVDLKFE